MGLQLAIKLPMYGQAPDAPFEAVLRVARAAEEAGFATAYAIDHLVLPGGRFVGKTSADISRPYFLEPWTTLAAVAAVTERIALGPQVTPIGRLHPVFVAKMAANIDRISNGRVKLGVGLGHQKVEYVSNGLPFPPFGERYERMVEGLEIIRLLWETDGPVTYEGAHFMVRDADFWPKPIHRIPFWFGGGSDSILDAVVRLGDGWAPAAPQLGGFGPEGAGVYRARLDGIRERVSAGDNPRPIGGGAVFLSTVSERQADLQTAAALLRRREEYAQLSIDGINDIGAVIIGTPDDVSRRLEPYVEAGIDELTVSFHPLDDIDGMLRGIDLYAEKIAPRFA
jgi:alkanesulfonate monooxygenase SsuD/methylene tetrahydromethanopterin reductase-like flavin-dependent oxidoreductase (luciferase family)